MASTIDLVSSVEIDAHPLLNEAYIIPSSFFRNLFLLAFLFIQLAGRTATFFNDEEFRKVPASLNALHSMHPMLCPSRE